jgi:hypothetical protein
MSTAKWTINTGKQQDLYFPAARFNEKVCLLGWGGVEMLLVTIITIMKQNEQG